MLQNMLERLADFFSHSYGANSIYMNLYFCPEYLGETHRFLFSGCGRENYELPWPSWSPWSIILMYSNAKGKKCDRVLVTNTGNKWYHGRWHVDQEVEDGEEGEGEDVHEDQVEPGHVHLRQTQVTCDLWHTSRFFLLKLTLYNIRYVSNPVTFPSSHDNLADDDYWRCGVDWSPRYSVGLSWGLLAQPSEGNIHTKCRSFDHRGNLFRNKWSDREVLD